MIRSRPGWVAHTTRLGREPRSGAYGSLLQPPDIVTRLRRVLSGQGRDRVSHRTVPSLRQKQTRLTVTQRSEVVERYRVGESAKALAVAFGVDRRTVTNIIRRAGGEVRYRVLTDPDVGVARALYEKGQSLADVGGHLGVSGGTVLNAFRRAGVSTRATGTNQWSREGPPGVARPAKTAAT